MSMQNVIEVTPEFQPKGKPRRRAIIPEAVWERMVKLSRRVRGPEVPDEGVVDGESAGRLAVAVRKGAEAVQLELDNSIPNLPLWQFRTPPKNNWLAGVPDVVPVRHQDAVAEFFRLAAEGPIRVRRIKRAV